MFDRYYCIKTFCDARKLDNFKENVFEKFLYLATEFLWKKYVHGMCFDYAGSRA